MAVVLKTVSDPTNFTFYCFVKLVMGLVIHGPVLEVNVLYSLAMENEKAYQ